MFPIEKSQHACTLPATFLHKHCVAANNNERCCTIVYTLCAHHALYISNCSFLPLKSDPKRSRFFFFFFPLWDRHMQSRKEALLKDNGVFAQTLAHCLRALIFQETQLNTRLSLAGIISRLASSRGRREKQSSGKGPELLHV